MNTTNITIAVGLAGLLACTESKVPIEDGVRIRVAALTLPGVSKVCYDLRVTNDPGGGGETVWSKGEPGLNDDAGDDDAICSDVFGNDGGGDITYIGPCDADAQEDPSDDAGERTNSITVWFDGIYDGAGDYVDPTGPEAWQNPCPAPLGCTLDVLCEENADALVTFDFTVLRDANQGFFDVAVNFEDIFCSAKLDTCYDDEHIELLFGSDTVRDWTAVFGFACTAGPGDAETLLHYGELAIVCGTTTFPIDPTGDEGNHDVTVDGYTLNYGIYRGEEQLDCDDPDTLEVESCNKLYWNLAFSLDDLAAVGAGCTLAFSATATDGDTGFTAGLPTAEGVSYPYIDVDAALTPAACHHYGADDGIVVRTVYHGNVNGLPEPAAMCTQFDGTTAGPVAGACASALCPFTASELVSKLLELFPPGTEAAADSGCFSETDATTTYVYIRASYPDRSVVYAPYTVGDFVDPDWQYRSGIDASEYGTDESWETPTDLAGHLACVDELTAVCTNFGLTMNVPIGCDSDANCDSSDSVCDTATRECVECVDDEDCAANSDGRTTCDTSNDCVAPPPPGPANGFDVTSLTTSNQFIYQGNSYFSFPFAGVVATDSSGNLIGYYFPPGLYPNFPFTMTLCSGSFALGTTYRLTLVNQVAGGCPAITPQFISGNTITYDEIAVTP